MDEKDRYKADMGKRIQQARREARLTQMRFAERIDVSTQYVSDLERGIVGCSVPTLMRICDVLDVSADMILKGERPEAPSAPMLPEGLSGLSPAEQGLVREGLELLKRAFSLRDAKKGGDASVQDDPLND